MKYLFYINEMKNYISLYHFTNITFLTNILLTNELEGSLHKISYKNRTALKYIISFTRNIHLDKLNKRGLSDDSHYLNYIEFDRNQLKNNYKLVPRDDRYHKTKGGSVEKRKHKSYEFDDESEEAIILKHKGGIHNVKKYIKSIKITKKAISNYIHDFLFELADEKPFLKKYLHEDLNYTFSKEEYINLLKDLGYSLTKETSSDLYFKPDIEEKINELANTKKGISFEDFFYYKTRKKIGKFIDRGIEGHVFSISNDPKRVIKFTKYNNTDVYSNMQMLNRKVDGFIQIYNIGKIEFPKNIKINLDIFFREDPHEKLSVKKYIEKYNEIYYIIMEKAFPVEEEYEGFKKHLSKIKFFEKEFDAPYDHSYDLISFINYNFIKSIDFYLEVTGLKSLDDFFDYLIELANKKIKNMKYNKMFVELINILKNCNKYFIIKDIDIHDDQLMKNKNGELVLVDIGNKTSDEQYVSYLDFKNKIKL